MGRFRAALLGFASVTACSFTPGSPHAVRDGDVDDVVVVPDVPPDVVPDAGPCQTAGASCTGDVLRTCTTVGLEPAQQTCAWGCTGTAPSASCAELAPAGGWDDGTTGDTTDFTNLLDIVIPDGAVINSTTGAITDANATGSFRAAGVGTMAGIDVELRAIGTTGRFATVFRFHKLTISNVSVSGTNAVVLIADQSIDVSGVIDAVPACAFADTRTPGPGGFTGGTIGISGEPMPPDGGGTSDPAGNDKGGGGGGHGALGGDGGNNPSSGGAVRGDVTIAILAGGSGGGGGDSHAMAGPGGGGGGAIQLIANGPIQLVSNSGINAGGCGGRAGKGTNDGGGGGGAGGAILIEAPTVDIEGTIAVNGGGGGGGNTGADTVGQKAQLSRTPATGGPAGTGSSGGVGAAGGGTLTGGVGTSGSGGGGGGAIGRIRINTRTGAVTRTNAILSPAPGDSATTYSEATAAVR